MTAWDAHGGAAGRRAGLAPGHVWLAGAGPAIPAC